MRVNVYITFMGLSTIVVNTFNWLVTNTKCR